MLPSNQTNTADNLETVHDITKRNVQLIAELEASARSERSNIDRIIDSISAFVGSVKFVWLHVAWFGVWMILNKTGVLHFDPYPFNLLTLIVSLEAIILSTFILISQNRQGRLAERRSHLDLQINLLSEQENTKIIAMLVAIMEKLKIDDDEPDTAVMLESTEPKNMVQQIQEIIEREDLEKQIEDESE